MIKAPLHQNILKQLFVVYVLQVFRSLDLNLDHTHTQKHKGEVLNLSI